MHIDICRIILSNVVTFLIVHNTKYQVPEIQLCNGGET